MQEIYKDVVGYQGKYQVSNLGNVKSLANDKSRKEKILKHKLFVIHHKNRDYVAHRIGLFKNGKRKTFAISRLVFQAFKGKIPNGYEIDHVDNDPQNNKLENLQILTKSENNKKRFIDNPNLGKIINIKNKKKIVCLNNGIIYNSISECSQHLNLDVSCLIYVLKGKRNHTKGYTFRYVIDDNNKDKDDEQQLQLFK